MPRTRHTAEKETAKQASGVHKPRAREVAVGVLIAHTPEGDVKALEHYASRLVRDIAKELESASKAKWDFEIADKTRLSDDEAKRPSDFLDEATMKMAEGPFDIVLVITDAPLYARTHAVVGGLASPISRVAVLSTRKLLIVPRGKPIRSLTDESVRWNGAKLALHLIGHMLELRHTRANGIMGSFTFDEDLKEVPPFTERERHDLTRIVNRAPEAQLVNAGALRSFFFHLASFFIHFKHIAIALSKNRAVFLPLALPSLTTAAIAPTLVLLFTAEIWDAGLSMTNVTAAQFTIGSIIAAVFYLTSVHDLYFPRNEKRVVTRHMAVVNCLIFFTITLALIGLFLMVAGLMLVVVLYIFPQGLIATWPTLEHPNVGLIDKFRLVSLISTIGVLTGAAAGGLESRTLIRHLSLFLEEP